MASMRTGPDGRAAMGGAGDDRDVHPFLNQKFPFFPKTQGIKPTIEQNEDLTKKIKRDGAELGQDEKPLKGVEEVDEYLKNMMLIAPPREWADEIDKGELSQCEILTVRRLLRNSMIRKYLAAVSCCRDIIDPSPFSR
ncbi:hypothetical protein NUW58_g2487 [Xylaria curta]|uniref:Uncharacterized protein n=1 Tax=Xylaria curta TaxID=42375 RepID=A0ACC1PHQ7_9PEZI|nr:hypothetical protein NUW58_g2487 [Xylaria curta]